MLRLTLPHDDPRIEIDGMVFDLRKSDAEILDDALRLEQKYAGLSEDTPPGDVLAGVREVTGLIDEILGEGAVRKLSQGKPVSISLSLMWAKMITAAVVRGYLEGLGEYE